MVLHVPTMPAVETTAALERRVARLSSLGRDEMTKLRAQLSGLEGELECVLASSVDLSRDLRLRRHTEHPPHSAETARISEENARVAEERAEERSRIASGSLRKERLRAEGKAAEIEALRVSLSLVGDELRASELRATEARALRLTSGDERVAAIDLWSRKQARLTRMCFPMLRTRLIASASSCLLFHEQLLRRAWLGWTRQSARAARDTLRRVHTTYCNLATRVHLAAALISWGRVVGGISRRRAAARLVRARRKRWALRIWRGGARVSMRLLEREHAAAQAVRFAHSRERAAEEAADEAAEEEERMRAQLVAARAASAAARGVSEKERAAADELRRLLATSATESARAAAEASAAASEAASRIASLRGRIETLERSEATAMAKLTTASEAASHVHEQLETKVRRRVEACAAAEARAKELSERLVAISEEKHAIDETLDELIGASRVDEAAAVELLRTLERNRSEQMSEGELRDQMRRAARERSHLNKEREAHAHALQIERDRSLAATRAAADRLERVRCAAVDALGRRADTGEIILRRVWVGWARLAWRAAIGDARKAGEWREARRRRVAAFKSWGTRARTDRAAREGAAPLPTQQSDAIPASKGSEASASDDSAHVRARKPRNEPPSRSHRARPAAASHLTPPTVTLRQGAQRRSPLQEAVAAVGRGRAAAGGRGPLGHVSEIPETFRDELSQMQRDELLTLASQLRDALTEANAKASAAVGEAACWREAAHEATTAAEREAARRAEAHASHEAALAAARREADAAIEISRREIDLAEATRTREVAGELALQEEALERVAAAERAEAAASCARAEAEARAAAAEEETRVVTAAASARVAAADRAAAAAAAAENAAAIAEVRADAERADADERRKRQAVEQRASRLEAECAELERALREACERREAEAVAVAVATQRRTRQAAVDARRERRVRGATRAARALLHAENQRLNQELRSHSERLREALSARERVERERERVERERERSEQRHARDLERVRADALVARELDPSLRLTAGALEPRPSGGAAARGTGGGVPHAVEALAQGASAVTLERVRVAEAALLEQREADETLASGIYSELTVQLRQGEALEGRNRTLEDENRVLREERFGGGTVGGDEGERQMRELKHERERASRCVDGLLNDVSKLSEEVNSFDVRFI